MENMQISINSLKFDPNEFTPKEYEQHKADLYNASVGDLNEADGYNCDICKNKGFVHFVKEEFGYYYETAKRCKCMKTRDALRRLQRSGLKDIVKDYSFDKYETPQEWQAAIKEAAQKFCKDEKHNFFFIGGQSGAGKTHICSAITVQYLRQGKEAKYMLWREEIPQIKAAVNDFDKYNELMKPLKETEVLYIDDLFKTGKDNNGKVARPTAADVNIAFEVINYRYNNPRLITIISTERDIQELFDIDEAIAGRIIEKAKPGGYSFLVKREKSNNWRLKNC